MGLLELPPTLRIEDVASLKSELPHASQAIDGVVSVDASGVAEIDLAGVQLLLAWARSLDELGLAGRLVTPSAVLVESIRLLELQDSLLGDPRVVTP